MSRIMLVAALSAMLLVALASVVVGGSPQGAGPAVGAQLRSGQAAPTARTREEVLDIIRTVGPTVPDWFDSVPLQYPATLNLQWKQVQQGWAPDHNMGAWMRTRIWEKPDQWRSGIKVLHHAVEVNADNPDALQTSRAVLAQCYYFLLQDYARAAYWNGQAGNSNPLLLAECCWKLGSKELAAEVLSGIPANPQNAAGAMKVWGEMGEYQKALALAEQVSRGGQPDLAYLTAGDAARANGRLDEALKYYTACADVQTGGHSLTANKERASASAKAVQAFRTVDVHSVADGTYSGTSAGGYKGPVTVEVTVSGGRIEKVRVASYSDNWYGASVEHVPARIVEEQGIRGVDAVTGATTTSRAIINATMTALSGPGKQP